MTDKELFITLTISDKPKKCDAVVLLEGDGFARLRKSCGFVIDDVADILIFSGGMDNEKAGSFTFEKCRQQLLDSGIDQDKILLEGASLHTREQAENVLQICAEREWRKIILVASHYHQFRAFLTFLKVLIERGLERKMLVYNAPETDLSWFDETGWGRRIDLVQEEFRKIDQYTEMGHIATYKQAVEYFIWRSQN